MKVYVDKQNMKLLGVEKERPFYTGDIFSSTLTVYFDTDVSNSSVTLSFLLANGRTPRKNLIPDDARTITFSEAKFGHTTWYSYTWELSAKEGLLVTPGAIQMTLTVTTNDVVEQVMFTNNVVRTSRFGANENLVIFGDDPEDIILDFATNIANINASLYKFRYIGSFNTKGSMYQAAFNEIYTNNYSMVSARFYDNVFIFLRSDAEGEQYLFMIDSSLYKYYKLKNDGTMIETDGANLSGFIYLTSASGTLSADQIENVNKNLCYILYNNRVYQKNSSTVDSMTFVNYDLLYSDDVFNAARYTITITISGNTYSYASSSKLVETYTKEQINSLLNSKIYYNDVKNNLTSTDINKPLSANQGKVLKGLIDAINSDLSGNYLTKKPDGTNDIVSNGKVSTIYLPDFLLGQLLFGGTFNATSAVATLTTNAKSKLGVSSNTLTLTNDSTQSTGYASNEGTFFVVETSGTFAGLEFATGDWLISIGTAWKKVDNTDEVTSVNGQTGNVTTGTYDKPEGGIPASDLAQAVQDALNKANSSVQDHQAIKVLKTDNETALTPGSSEDIKGDGTINLHKVSKTGTYADLIGKPTLGTAASHDVASEISLNNNDLVTSGQLYVALRDMPVPMVFKGTLGQNATISSLPTASSENNGFTYKVVTAGTYAGLSCAVGDLVVSNGELWIVIPAGDEAVTEDTWRGIKVNGTTLLANGITTGDLKIVEGTNVTITTNANKEIIFSATDTTYDNLSPAKDGENVSVVTTGEKYQNLAALLNLGERDVYPYNNDNTKILRRTKYLVINASDITSTSVETAGGSNVKFVFTKLIMNDADMNIQYGYKCGVSSLGYNVVRVGNYWLGDKQISVNSSGTAYDDYICIANNDFTTVEQFKALCPIYIQYQTSNTYIDTIIPKLPLNTLDQQGSQWLRDKWKKGLNLFDRDGMRVTTGTPTQHLVYLKNNVSYTFSWTSSVNDRVRFQYSLNGDYSGSYQDIYGTGNKTHTFTIPSGFNAIYIMFFDNSAVSNAMLKYSSNPYPYQDYHQAEHISDNEAELLKQEEEKCRNLFGQSLYQGGWDYDNNRTKYSSAIRVCNDTQTIVSPNTTYTITNSGNKQISIQYRTSAGAIISGSGWQNNNYTFTTPSNCSMVDIIFRNSDDSNLTPSQVGNIMLNKGTEAEPYQLHYGRIAHMSDLPTYLNELLEDDYHKTVTKAQMAMWNSASDTFPIYNNYPVWVDGNRYGTTPSGIYVCYPLMAFSVTIKIEGKLDASSWMSVYSTSGYTKPFILWVDGAANKIKITYFDGTTPFEHSAGFNDSTLSRVGFETSGYALVKKLLNVSDNISYIKDN